MATKKTPRPALLTLSFGNFVIGTGTMIIAGLLNLIAADLHTSVAAVGQLLAGYAIAVCVGAPILAGITSHISRRKLLVGALVLFAVGHAFAAVAPDYTVLMALRVLTGFGAAIFTPQAAATAGVLAPPQQRGRAIALVFLGFSLSSVLGNPISIYLGAAFGWRTALAVVGGISALCAVLLYRQIPQRFYVQRIDAAAWHDVWRNRALLLVLATSVLQAAGQFVLLTYVAAVFKEYIAATPAVIGLLFSWIGVTGLIGNVIAGLLMDRIGAARAVAIATAFILAGFLLWPLTRGSMPLMIAALGLWGLGAFAVNGAQQARLVALAPRLASASVALNSSSFYLGQATGAMLGGAALTSLGMSALSWVGAAILVLAFGASFVAEHRARAQPA